MTTHNDYNTTFPGLSNENGRPINDQIIKIHPLS